MSKTDLLNFKLMVARTDTERGLIRALVHADTLAADLRQTPIEKERTTEAVAYVRSRINTFQQMKRMQIGLYAIPMELRKAA